MSLRRPARLFAAAALVLAAPALTSCGFDYATDRVYTPGAGTNVRDNTVDVLGAVVVSAEAGAGTLIATFVNNLLDEEATVTEITGAGDDADLEIEGFTPITIAPNGLINLATEDTPIIISGDYEEGAFLTLDFVFDDGTSAELQVPTIADCYEYAGLDAAAETPTPAEECEPPAPVEGAH